MEKGEDLGRLGAKPVSFVAQILPLPYLLYEAFKCVTVLAQSVLVGMVEQCLTCGLVLRLRPVDINPFAEQAMMISKGTWTQPIGMALRFALPIAV